jgi:alkanesulfonate monooxygenase SsuD/methylene tetrahydromethanopterin reductase-like flavin-dependent oxidoreductase (luciferase family)
VVPLQFRTPQTAAMAAATLQALDPEREVLLGIGLSSPVITQQWHGVPYGDRPVARVREYVALLRACLSGEPVTFEGDFWSCRGFRLGVRLGERRPRIVVAALNPQMLRLAGEVADGVLLNYVPPSHVGWSIEQVRAGGDATIYAYVHVGVGERNDDTLVLGRRDLFTYASAPAYQASFERAGYAEEMEAFRAAKRARDRDGQLEAISERMVDEIDTFGSVDLVRSTVDAYRTAGVEVPIIMPLPWGTDRRRSLFDTIEALA